MSGGVEVVYENHRVGGSEGGIINSRKREDLGQKKKDINFSNDQNNIDFMGHYVLFQQCS